MIRPDGTAECYECGLPMFPYERSADGVRLECANHHRSEADAPGEASLARLVDAWIARRGAQLHAQHERWEREEEQ